MSSRLTSLLRSIPRSTRLISSLPVSTRHTCITPTTRSVRHFSSVSNASVLLIADILNGKLTDATVHSISAASKISSNVTVLVHGKNVKSIAEQVSKYTGVTKVLSVDHDAYAHAIAENTTKLVLELQKKHNFAYIVAPSTAAGKNVLPRIAVNLDVNPISDVIEVKSADTFVRPIYAGNALATVQSSDNVKVLSVRPTNFEKASTGGNASIESMDAPADADAKLSTWVKDELSVSTRPELSSARVVVSGGRGMKSGENFKMLEELADKLGGAVGASRAAVDAGFVPNDYQVGQTGKVVAPELYIAVGISGAIQHLAGMKDSKVIVAINKDAEAPIFQVADYGVVGDLFKVVPEVTTLVPKKA